MYLYLAYVQFQAFLCHQFQINCLYSGIIVHLQVFQNCDQEKDEQQNLVRHNNMSFFPTKEDAEQALCEIVHQRFEEVLQ